MSVKSKIKKRGRRPMTVKQKLHAFLVRKGDYTHLSAIYKSMKAETTVQKAGIRGLLNKGLGETGLFMRNEKAEGEYKAA